MENKDLIIRLWNSRVAINKIPDLVPQKKVLTKKQIKQLLDNGEIQPRIRNAEHTRQQIKDIYFDKTQNFYEIAEMLGISPKTVKKELSILKINRVRPKKNYKKRETPSFDKLCDKTQNIILAIKNGDKVAEITKRFSVSRQYVSKLAIKYCKGKENESKL